jgi:hypothetical protein
LKADPNENHGTLLTALLLVPPAAMHAADVPTLQPPQYFGGPKTEHAVTNRALTMAPSITVTPKRRLWAIFTLA